MRTSVEKSPGWLRGIQIGLGIIMVMLSIYALAFPAVTFLALIVILAIGTVVLASPLFGAVFVGLIIAHQLLIQAIGVLQRL